MSEREQSVLALEITSEISNYIQDGQYTNVMVKVHETIQRMNLKK